MSGKPQLKTASLPSAQAPVIVVGAGPVGIRAAQELARRSQQVIVLSAERVLPYNRVQLTPLLCGDVQFGRISLVDADDTDLPFDIQLGQSVVRIDRDAKSIVTSDGGIWPYDNLVLATGSTAFVPGIPGKDLPGVYTFRTADDASALIARSFSARKIAVIGGGLLGLEAARGMRQRNCDVTVIEHESHLMPRQLDKAGGAILAENIEALKVDVITGCAVKEITGTHRVEGLTLADGRHLDCDTVIICTGVRANIWLAREAGLAFQRGITVNDRMQSSDPSIYAVGECAEHNHLMYGLVGPGYAQAEVAAAQIAGDVSSFDHVAPTTKLKVIGADVFSAGEIEQLEVGFNTRSHVWQDGKFYRRIFIERGALVGALAVGEWAQSSRVQDAVNEGATIYPWMLHRFRKTGQIWIDEDVPAADLPAHATVCNCTGVTCGQIRKSIGAGAQTVDAIGEETGAGTVCGTCQPLMAEIIDAGADPAPVKLWKPILGLSALAVLGALWPLILGNVPLPTSYDADSLRVWLWQDNIVKQWSGFILLGLTVTAMAIGLRKRFRFMDRLGSFDGWRLVHLGLGLVALAALFAHTGFSLGSGWNLALGATFVALAGTGALAGLATGGDHELRARGVGTTRKPARRLPVWAHILLLWPLPVLIAFHVLASYLF